MLSGAAEVAGCNFRPFLSTSIDRGVHIDRFGVKKSIWNVEENQRKPEENCSGPENENASISLGKYNANAKEFSTVFEHLDRSTRPHRSNRRRKNRFLSKGEINGASAKICSGPENQNSSISLGNYNANATEFSTVFEHLDRSKRPHGATRRQKMRIWFCRKINANPKKIVRAPILVDKYNANGKEFSAVFEHLDRSRRPHRSNRRRTSDFWFCRKINANPKKIVRAPKIAMRRFH